MLISKAIFVCEACNVDFHLPSKLNKHLSVCDKYDEWIKSCEPPKLEKCENCERQIIKNYYPIHKQTCFSS